MRQLICDICRCREWTLHGISVRAALPLASWWGKVIGDIESLRAAAFFTLSESPKELPITRLKELFPPTARLSNLRASSSLLIIFPSMHIAITVLFPAAERMASASVSRAAFITFSDGSSGRRASGSSVILIWQYAPRRFVYSAQASRR